MFFSSILETKIIKNENKCTCEETGKTLAFLNVNCPIP